MQKNPEKNISNAKASLDGAQKLLWPLHEYGTEGEKARIDAVQEFISDAIKALGGEESVYL